MSILEKLISEDFTLTNLTGRYSRTVEHDSLILDRYKNKFYWNSQGISGNAYWYLVRVRGILPHEAGNILKVKDYGQLLSLMQDNEDDNKDPVYRVDDTCVVQARLVNLFHETGKEHREYWYNERGYTDETIDRFRLGYTGEWYTIPFFVDGIFRNFQVRKTLPDGTKKVRPWYRGVGPLPFNFSALSFTDWVIITEGPPDAIMLRQNNLPAVSHNGGSEYWNSQWNYYFGHIKKFFIVYDNDLAGNKGSVKVAEQWGGRASVYNFWDYPEKYDVTDYFKNGGNSEDFLSMVIEKGKAYYEVRV